MIEQKDKQVLAELMQFGYDRNVIAFIDMKVNPELEEQIEELSKTVLQSNWDWFNSTEEQFEEEYKRKTGFRFCFTVGIGAAWFWENKKDDVITNGLYGCMEKPRTNDEMDEYIEDVTGIWWSDKSIDHNRNLCLLDDCVAILNNYYDLTDKEQEHRIGYVLMLFGMYYGYTRISKERVIEQYKGEMPWHWEIWEKLYGAKGNEHLEEFNKWALAAFEKGKMGSGVYVILNDPHSEFGKINKYYRPFTYQENAGIRILVETDDDQSKMLTATPVFDTTRCYPLVIEKVYVWENGVEASIKARFLNAEHSCVIFYDTNYLENKDKYYIGAVCMFDLYAIAYRVKIVPEEHRSFTFEGEKAINFHKKLGEDPQYDENGNPKPIVFHTGNMHSFLQIDNKFPEDAEFRSPIKKVFEDIDYLGKKVYHVEIGIPLHRIDNGDDILPISVYIAADENDNLPQRPEVGEPIYGDLYLQGKMRCMINEKEIPSKVLHTFDAKEVDGSVAVFNHICDESDNGKPMDEEEIQKFAKEVYYQLLSKRQFVDRVDQENENLPDFRVSRNRELWIKADINYTAGTDFLEEKKDKYLYRYFVYRYYPVIAYISLYDIDGKECKWLKGGKYTAKIHYGSVLPNQKMGIMRHKTHDELVHILFDSIKHFDTHYLSRFLHKDLDFRSVNLADPIITREEYLTRTETVNSNNLKAKNGHAQPELLQDKDGDAYIELHYPNGVIDVVKVETKDGFITAIHIENLKSE